MDWGSIPEWFAAVTTAGTLVVTLLLIRRQLLVWTGESSMKRKGQASLVSAWTLPPPLGDKRVTRVRYRNASDQPIYGLRIWLTLSDGETRLVRSGSPVGPGFEEEFEVEAREASDDAPWDTVQCDFVDSSGVHWHRSGLGRLVVVGEDVNPWKDDHWEPPGEIPSQFADWYRSDES